MPLGYEVDEGAAVITLDRPDVLNAFDDELGGALRDAVVRAAADEGVRCIVITGAGRAFSAGEDLGALAGGYERGQVPELGRILEDRYNPLIRAIREAPKPVVAAVNGIAAGAGASVALACDWRVASERAKLALAFVKVGLVPDSGALWFLSRMIGSARTWRLAATGEVLTAERAGEHGIFDEIVAEDVFDQAWRERARSFAAGPTRAYAVMKRLTDAATSSSLDEQLDLEVGAQTEAGLTSDHVEGVRAFFAKRPPTFHGR
ncbi:MAG: enoyl-CoA hydratase-related protein [Actinomycetota bacterium]